MCGWGILRYVPAHDDEPRIGILILAPGNIKGVADVLLSFSREFAVDVDADGHVIGGGKRYFDVALGCDALAGFAADIDLNGLPLDFPIIFPLKHSQAAPENVADQSRPWGGRGVGIGASN